MTVATMTWRNSGTYSGTYTTLATALAGIKSSIDSEVAAHPTTALWQVADSSAPNGTLTLKATSVGITAGIAAAYRIMIFGGQVPNVAAVGPAGPTLGTGRLYCGCAPTANVDAPQQSYATGVPYTTGQWVAGGFCTGTFTSMAKIQYYESIGGIIVLIEVTSMSGAASQCSLIAAGALMVSPDGTAQIDCAWGSGDCLVAQPWTISSAVPGGYVPAATAAPSGDQPQLMYIDIDDTAATRGFRLFAPTGSVSGATSRMKRTNKAYFLPIMIGSVGTGKLGGRLRQMAFGQIAAHGDIVNDVSAVKQAQAISLGGATPWDALWLTDFVI